MAENIQVNEKQIWCVVPVYNNRDTVRNVVSKCISVCKNVVVVDDGSTDVDVSNLLSGMDIIYLKHEKNLGKGQAILTAARYVGDADGRYIITIDADGQHNPDDISKFYPLILENDSSLIIGCRDFDTDNIPPKSRFGRKFANFWLRVETGKTIDDCQSGFRAYPVFFLNKTSFRGRHYDFEAEVLAKASWAGLELKMVDIDVYYPKPEERVSHFKPYRDNLRLTLTHSMLVVRHLLPIGHKRLVEKERIDYKHLFCHPVVFLKKLILDHSTPRELALSAAVGIFLAVLPLLFVHTVVILYFSIRLRLNKALAVNIQHLCMPPFVPVLCIESGYFMRHGRWLTEASYETIFLQFSDRLVEWFLGSLIIAPIAAALAWIVVFFLAKSIKEGCFVNG
jgi:glycosyltransferase involved in cell wall biosynthesis